MFTVFATALTALNANSTAVSVVGNNLANLNTTGFKDTRVGFQDLLTETIGGIGGFQVGLGTARPQTLRQFNQGSLQSSAGALDSAIQGQGFFVVNNVQGAQVFTRDGSFTTDANGYLVDAQGQRVQGWMTAGGVTNTNAPTGDLVIPSGTLLPPTATKNVSLSGNLDASAVVGAPSATFTQAIQVYDSLGTAHTLTYTFNKTANNAWSYTVTIPGADLTAGTAGTPSQIAMGTMSFDGNGNLTDPTKANGAIPLAITGLTDGAADMSPNWNLYNAQGVPSFTQVAQTSAIANTTQDGSSAAQLVNVAMADGGVLTAQYSNGQTKTVGQLAIASIRNPDSLIGVGSNDYQVSALTAPPTIGASQTGGRGQIVGQSLEQSTVDIGQEFTNLITLQRAYQANSRVITTADQITQETVNLIHG